MSEKVHLITTQKYICKKIVEEKKIEGDFMVTVSPELNDDYCGKYRVLLDGHHRYQAATELGIDPNFYEADSTDHDAICMLDRGDVVGFLEEVGEGEYIYADTKKIVW